MEGKKRKDLIESNSLRRKKKEGGYLERKQQMIQSIQVDLEEDGFDFNIYKYYVRQLFHFFFFLKIF